MTVLRILQVDSAEDLARLRQKAKKIKHLDGSTQQLIDDMIETVRAASGVGLAANQVGTSLRLAVIEIPPEPPPSDEETPSAGQSSSARERDEAKLYVLVNPEIVKQEGEREIEEGCLSLPGYRGIIKRAERVIAKARNRQGKPIRIKAEGLLAQALEHEIDHLNGILYFDHLDSLEQLYKVEPKEGAETEEKGEPILVTERGGEAGGGG